MLRGFRWLAVAGVLATAALVGPSIALADGCGGSSATNIYVECTPSASGKHHSTTGQHHAKPAPVSTPSTSVPPPYVAPAPVHVSHKAKHVIARSGKFKYVLSNLVRNPGLVDTQRLKIVPASAPTTASLGSAFDLGSGPMILFALLLGAVLALVGTGGVRSWRNRYHQ